MSGALELLKSKRNVQAVANRPERATFKEFLLEDARVPKGDGTYTRYTFEGREALEEIVDVIDMIIAKRWADAGVGVAGGAQFGKTVLELNLAAYATSQRFLGIGLFLPDDKLVDGVIDAKFRPDVMDQIGWFADMVKVGKAINNSGKAVDTKGAFTVNDGRRKAIGMALGLQKPATTFSFDIALEDEVDDIPAKNEKYVSGRLTNSQLRLIVRIGTQRVHGRGQNKVWKDGSQGVVEIGGHNPEDKFPGIIRCAVTGKPHPSDPKLTLSADFRHDDRPEIVVAVHKPTNLYYLADPVTGAPLNRNAPKWVHRRPERIEDRNWTFRISQLSIAAIDLQQIVAKWQKAVTDSEHMTVFRCDVLASPASTAQVITPFVIERAQQVNPFDMRLRPEAGRKVFGGIDVGDKCWFVARERESEAVRRMIYAEALALGDLEMRAVALFYQLGLSCLFIDQRPDAAAARAIALAINGLNQVAEWPENPEKLESFQLGTLSWDGVKKKWHGLKCAPVAFSKHGIGAGVEHGFDFFSQGGKKKFVPLIKCNREDSIDKVVRELLTTNEGVAEIIDGKPRMFPSMLLPRKSSNPILETVEEHFITGSEREKNPDGSKGDYVDQCANHFLLANAYSALAEGEGSAADEVHAGEFIPVKKVDRFVQGMRDRRDRRIIG